MSWIDRLTNIKFKITTGDGKVFTPLWVNGESSIEFNTKKYEFINVPGSMIDRKLPKATAYPLVFYFQGDDNVDQSEEFIKSAKDSRPWKVNHPFYGQITGQPTSLSRNDNAYNVTAFTVDFWETITADYPNDQVSTRDVILTKVSDIKAQALTNYVTGANPSSGDISVVKENSKDVASKFDRLQTPDTFVTYKNTLSNAVKAADNIIEAPNEVITSNQELVLLPSTYELPVTQRITALKNTYFQLKSVIVDRNGKFFFESQAGTTVAAIAQASVNPIDEDYTTRDQVSLSSEAVIEIYNDYLTTLDDAQVDQYDVVNEWSPDPQLQQTLYELITETLGNLYQLAFGAKQERIVEVDTDTNLFLLVHRYMGLDGDDKNLETFRIINNIKNDELFRIRKGRKIKYFV